MRRILFFAKRSWLLMAVTFVFIAVALPYGMLMLRRWFDEADFFHMRETVPYFWTALCFLSCLWPLDIMRIYVGTKGNEVLLKDNRYPNKEAYVFGGLYVLTEGLFFLQVERYLPNGKKAIAAILCLTAVVITASIALFALCESVVLTTMASLMLSAGMTMFKSPWFRVTDFPNPKAVSETLIVGTVITVFFVVIDFFAVRRITFR